jgi:hypothetical protein
MKVRAIVIFACMTVVPALALFSHRLPAEVRAAVRSRLWEPVESWAASLTHRDVAASSEAVAAATPPADPDPPTVALPGPGTTPPAQPVPHMTPAATAMVAAPDGRAALVALGAVTIDCRPFDGLAGTHVASCRVAVDTSGQLHRVFQAAGRSPDEAMASLEQAVRAWQSRRAALGRAGENGIQF